MVNFAGKHGQNNYTWVLDLSEYFKQFLIPILRIKLLGYEQSSEYLLQKITQQVAFLRLESLEHDICGGAGQR